MEQLISIQSELKCPKGNYNAFGKYKYRSAEQILEAVKPLLRKYKCTLIIKDDVLELGGTHVLRATAILSNGKDSIDATGFAGIDYGMKGMSMPQIYGSSSSYARKYALNGLFLIDETESDADHQNKGESKKIVLTEMNPNFINIKKALAGGTHTIEQVKAKYEISSEIEKLLK